MPDDEVTREGIKQDAKEMASQLAREVTKGLVDTLTGAIGVRGLEKAFADLGQKLGKTLSRSVAETVGKEPVPAGAPVSKVRPVEYGRELEHFHRQLERMAVQLQNTIDLLQKAGIAVVSEREMQRIEQVTKAILERQGITPETAKEFVATVKQVQDALVRMGSAQEDFRVDVGDIFDRYHKILEDSRVSIDIQRDLIRDIQRYMAAEETPVAERIRAFDVTRLDRERLKEFLALIDEARAGETGELRETLESLNEKLAGAVLTPGEIQKTWSERVRAAGKPFVEAFMETPGQFTMGRQVRRGLMDVLFGGLGMGPLAQAAGLPERMEALWGAGMGRIKGWAGGLLGPGEVPAGRSAAEELRATREESRRGTDKIVKAVEALGKRRDVPEEEHRSNIRRILDRIHRRPSQMIPEIEETADIAMSPRMLQRMGPRFVGWLRGLIPSLASWLGIGAGAGAVGALAKAGLVVGGLAATGATIYEAFKTGKEEREAERARKELAGLGAVARPVGREVTTALPATGLLPEFLKTYGKQFGITAAPGTKEYETQVRAAMAKQPEEIATAAHRVLMYESFMPLTRYMAERGLPIEGKPQLREAVYELATTHPPVEQRRIIEAAAGVAAKQGQSFAQLPEERQIEILRQVRSAFISRRREVPGVAPAEAPPARPAPTPAPGKPVKPGAAVITPSPVLAEVTPGVAPTALAGPTLVGPGAAVVTPGAPTAVVPRPVRAELEPVALVTPTPAGPPVERITTLVPPRPVAAAAPPPPSIVIPPMPQIVEKRKTIDDYGIALLNHGMVA